MGESEPFFRPGAVLLCGGASSRMGAPKAWLPFGGEPLLTRIAARIAPMTRSVVVVAAPDQDLPPLPNGTRIVRDAVAGQGPLQGLLAGLSALADLTEAAFVCTTDAPFVHPALALRLEALRRESNADAAVPHTDGRTHPLAAVYRTSVGAAVRQLLEGGERRAMRLLDAIHTRIVAAEELLEDAGLRAADPELLSLRNINTREDYRAALDLLSRGA